MTRTRPRRKVKKQKLEPSSRSSSFTGGTSAFVGDRLPLFASNGNPCSAQIMPRPWHITSAAEAAPVAAQSAKAAKEHRRRLRRALRQQVGAPPQPTLQPAPPSAYEFNYDNHFYHQQNAQSAPAPLSTGFWHQQPLPPGIHIIPPQLMPQQQLQSSLGNCSSRFYNSHNYQLPNNHAHYSSASAATASASHEGPMSSRGIRKRRRFRCRPGRNARQQAMTSAELSSVEVPSIEQSEVTSEAERALAAGTASTSYEGPVSSRGTKKQRKFRNRQKYGEHHAFASAELSSAAEMPFVEEQSQLANEAEQAFIINTASRNYEEPVLIRSTRKRRRFRKRQGIVEQQAFTSAVLSSAEVPSVGQSEVANDVEQACIASTSYEGPGLIRGTKTRRKFRKRQGNVEQQVLTSAEPFSVEVPSVEEQSVVTNEAEQPLAASNASTSHEGPVSRRGTKKRLIRRIQQRNVQQDSTPSQLSNVEVPSAEEHSEVASETQHAPAASTGCEKPILIRGTKKRRRFRRRQGKVEQQALTSAQQSGVEVPSVEEQSDMANEAEQNPRDQGDLYLRGLQMIEMLAAIHPD